jgi:hypothetical protein
MIVRSSSRGAGADDAIAEMERLRRLAGTRWQACYDTIRLAGGGMSEVATSLRASIDQGRRGACARV